MAPVIDLFYLMLPVYVANMVPPFARFWKGWNPPISKRWLGAHKTVVGFALGLLGGVATAFAQYQIGWSRVFLDYADWPILGLALGFGAMAGDSTKSFVKRRLAIAPGTSWIPADQIDFVIGGLIVLAFWVNLSVADMAVILAVSFAGDLLINRLSFRMGIRETPI